MDWTVDRCPEAEGHYTIRRDDGSEHGDTSGQPVATVYDADNAAKIAALPQLVRAARLAIETIEADQERMVKADVLNDEDRYFQGRCLEALRAAVAG